MNVTLGGHPLEPTITMRLEDFQAAIAAAATAARESFVAPELAPGVEVGPAAPADPPTPLPFKLATKKAAAAKKVAARKHATEGQRRWVSGQEPMPINEPGPYVPSEGTAPDLVLKALAKKPASSLELTELYPTVTSGSIYQAVKFLREKGLVEGFEDETDGTKRWRLCQK